MFPQTLLLTHIETGKNTHSWPEERQSVALWSDITCEQNVVYYPSIIFHILNCSYEYGFLTHYSPHCSLFSLLCVIIDLSAGVNQ